MRHCIVHATALTTVFVAVFGFESVLLIALGTLISAAVSIFLYSYYMQKCLKYTVKEQIADCLPFIFASVCMAAMVWGIHFIPMNRILVMFVQIITGAGFYIIVSKIFKIKEFEWVCSYAKNFLKRQQLKKQRGKL